MFVSVAGAVEQAEPESVKVRDANRWIPVLEQQYEILRRTAALLLGAGSQTDLPVSR